MVSLEELDHFIKDLVYLQVIPSVDQCHLQKAHLEDLIISKLEVRLIDLISYELIMP